MRSCRFIVIVLPVYRRLMVMVTPPSVLQASAFSNNLVHASILSHQMHFLLFQNSLLTFTRDFGWWLMKLSIRKLTVSDTIHKWIFLLLVAEVLVFSLSCLIWSFYWLLCVLMGHSWQISKIPFNVLLSVGCRGVGFLPLLPYLIPQTFLDNHSINSSLKTLLLLMIQLSHLNFLKSQDWYFCWMWVGE